MSDVRMTDVGFILKEVVSCGLFATKHTDLDASTYMCVALGVARNRGLISEKERDDCINAINDFIKPYNTLANYLIHEKSIVSHKHHIEIYTHWDNRFDIINGRFDEKFIIIFKYYDTIKDLEAGNFYNVCDSGFEPTDYDTACILKSKLNLGRRRVIEIKRIKV